MSTAQCSAPTPPGLGRRRAGIHTNVVFDPTALVHRRTPDDHHRHPRNVTDREAAELTRQVHDSYGLVPACPSVLSPSPAPEAVSWYARRGVGRVRRMLSYPRARMKPAADHRPRFARPPLGLRLGVREEVAQQERTWRRPRCHY